jgi:hypothetical protein
MQSANAPPLPGYACAWAVSHMGLDDVLLAPSACLAGHSTRGFIAELLAPASRPCSDGTVEQQAVLTRCYTA